MKKINDLTSTLRLCMEDVIEDAPQEELEEEFCTEAVSNEVKNA